MTDLLYSSAADATVNASTTRYYACGCGPVLQNGTTEAVTQRTERIGGVYRNLYAVLSTNTLTGNTTIRFRKNVANGNQSITISATSTGEFSDTSNTDIVAAGDEVNYQGVTGTGTNIILRCIATIFRPASGARNCLMAARGAQNISAASTTYYYKINGQLSNTSGTTEDNEETTMRTTQTFNNAQVNVTTNARGTNTTMGSRKNAANGNMVVTITASTTGIFEDTSNSDSVVSGDTYNYSLTTGTGGGNIALTGMSSTQLSSVGHMQWASGIGSTASLAAGSTIYLPVLGGVINSNTESDWQVDALSTVRLRNMQTYITANASTTTVTMALRKDASNANLSVSITALTTGLFSDTSNADFFSPTQEFTYAYSGGTTGAVSITSTTIVAEYNQGQFFNMF